MQDNEKLTLVAVVLFLALLASIPFGIAKLCQQQDVINRQAQQIKTYKSMLLKIPVDRRDEQGRRVKQ